MDFPKVAAFGTGMVEVVRVVACRLPVGEPINGNSFTTFLAVIIPFAAKKCIIRHLTMDFAITGSMWHRVVGVGTCGRLLVLYILLAAYSCYRLSAYYSECKA